MRVADSCRKELSKTRFYSATTYENYVKALPREASVAVVDSGCDHSVVGKEFYVTRTYLMTGSDKGISSPFDKSNCIRKKVDGITTLIDVDGRPKALLKLNQVYQRDAPDQELLLAKSQLEWSGCQVDDKAGLFGGEQRIRTPEGDIDLLFDGKTTYFCTRYPTHKDRKTLPTLTLTSSLHYEPCQFVKKVISQIKKESEPYHQQSPQCKDERLDVDELEDRYLPPMVNRRILWNEELLDEWSKRLGCVPSKTVKKTFENTTQMVPSVECENADYPKQHFKPRFPYLRPRNLNEKVYTDTIFWTCDGREKCGQVFLSARSRYAYFFPLDRESQNSKALEQYLTDVGAPLVLISDGAQAEVKSEQWKKICNRHHIRRATTEPRKQNQNRAERFVQELKKTAEKLFHRHQGGHHKYDNLLFSHIVDLHNHTGNCELRWSTPYEKMWGYTPDISNIRFKWWDRVWYYEHDQKWPARRMLPGRFVGIARNSGDEITYNILTQPETSDMTRPSVIVRSVVTPRRPNEKAHGEQKRLRSDFYFPRQESCSPPVEDDEPVESDPNPRGKKRRKTSRKSDLDPNAASGVIPDHSDCQVDPMDGQAEQGEEHANLKDTNGTPTSMSSFEGNHPHGRAGPVEGSRVEDDDNRVGQVDLGYDDGVSSSIRIESHRWFANGKNRFKPILKFKVEVRSDQPSEWMEYDDVKQDAPYKLADYILQRYCAGKEKNRKAPLEWAKAYLLKARRVTLQQMEAYGMYSLPKNWTLSEQIQQRPESRARRTKENRTERSAQGETNHTDSTRPRKRKATKQMEVQYGVTVPNNVDQAYELDRINGNTLWEEAIKKELDAINSYETFDYEPELSAKELKKKGYQFAPLRMIFCVKQDLRRKARLVIGGHVVDATGHEVYASVMKQISSRMLMIMAQANGQDVEVGDIGNAYLYAKTDEKIFTFCDGAFKRAGYTTKERTLAVVDGALYGLPTSGNRWHAALADTLRSMQFKPSRGDPDVWMRQNGNCYEYIGVHTDDVMVVSHNCEAIWKDLKSLYIIKKTGPPEYHLGVDYVSKVVNGKRQWYLGTFTYLRELMKRLPTITGIEDCKLYPRNKPLDPDYHPELDETPKLGKSEHRLYQQLIGIGVWVQAIGRMDIGFAISSMSRYSAAPREGHLKALIGVYGYLKKFQHKLIKVDAGVPVERGSPNTTPEGIKTMKEQYEEAVEELDPSFPRRRGKGLETQVWFDSNHAHDQVTRRSITGTIVYVGNTPVMWSSKRQGAIECSTYGAEFMAGRTALEEAKAIRYMLRSFGVPLEKPTDLIGDNMGMLQSSTLPGSQLKKKSVAISYHMVREATAAEIISPRFIRSELNRSDQLTKALGPKLLRSLNKSIYADPADCAELIKV